ncbi:MAG: hypothetical protein ABIM99_03120 [Candidatus Dojkabacteria bacterium]
MSDMLDKYFQLIGSSSKKVETKETPVIIQIGTNIKLIIQEILTWKACIWFVNSPIDLPEHLELAINVTQKEIDFAKQQLERYIEINCIPIEVRLSVKTENELLDIIKSFQDNYPEIEFEIEFVGNVVEYDLGKCKAYTIKFNVTFLEDN